MSAALERGYRSYGKGVRNLGIWESVFNPGFNCGEFAIIKSQAGLNSYSVKEWVEKTNAIDSLSPARRLDPPKEGKE